MSGRFVFADAFTGDLNLLPTSLCIDILDNNMLNVSAARWFNPLTNKYPKFTWLDFLEVFQDIQNVASSHIWLKEWCDCSSNRWISADIYGKRPYTEIHFDYPSSAWHHAKLEGEPLYELRFIENNKPCGTQYLGKNSSDAIIIDMSTRNGCWLDDKNKSVKKKK